MKNTGKQLGMYSVYYNWNFTRTIWLGEDGYEYVKVNDCPIELETAKNLCDSWRVFRR